MAEVEIIPFGGSGRNNEPRFTLRIITAQEHASELVQMFTSQICSTDLGVSEVNAEVADISQDQPQTYALSSGHTETHSGRLTVQQVTSLDLQTTNPSEHCVTATVHPIRITDDDDDEIGTSDDETQQYYPALSTLHTN